MFRSFGDRLLQFAQTVDIVDLQIFKDITQLIEDYISETLDIQSTRIMVESEVHGQLGLTKYALNPYEKISSCPIKDADGNYCGQMAYAYDLQKPLWVVSSENKEELTDATSYQELWSELTDVPQYVVGDQDGTKTSIIIPLYRELRVCGVLNFETIEYLEITQQAKDELLRIANTISILHHSSLTRDYQQASTKKVISQFKSELREESFPKLTKPKVFLASSSRAKDDIIGAIKDILNEYSDKLELIYWKEISELGNINAQLIKAISSCRYGICYFSEETEDGKFKDNPNVLIEAGMLHGRGDDLSPAPVSWIPIREGQSPPSPFDFAQERTIIIARDEAGKMSKEAFNDVLRASLDAMLGYQRQC